MANTIPVVLSKIERKDFSAARDLKKSSPESKDFAQVFSAKTHQQNIVNKSKADTKVVQQQSDHHSEKEVTHKSESSTRNNSTEQPKKVPQEHKMPNQNKQNSNQKTADSKQDLVKQDEEPVQSEQTGNVVPTDPWILSSNLLAAAQLQNQTSSETMAEQRNSEVTSSDHLLVDTIPVSSDFSQVQANVLAKNGSVQQKQSDQVMADSATETDAKALASNQGLENLVKQVSQNANQGLNQMNQSTAATTMPNVVQIIKTIDLPQAKQELQQLGLKQSEDVKLDSQPILNKAGKEFLFGGVVPEKISDLKQQAQLNQSVQLNSESTNFVSQLSLKNNSNPLMSSVFQQELSSESNNQAKSTSTEVEPNFLAALAKAETPVAATTSQVATTQNVQKPDVNQIISQIVDQAKMTLRPQNSEIVIHLKPEHLGEMTLKISVDQGSVQASFHTNNPEVRQALETSLLQLKNELQQAGLKVENVGVYTGMDQFMSGQQQRESSQNSKFSRPHIVREEVDETFSQAEAKIDAVDGVDYRI